MHRVFWREFLVLRQEAEDFLDGRADKDSITKKLGWLVEDVDSRLHWELGPGTLKPYQFALSPNRDEDLLEVTRGIVAAAPDIADWEFHPARQKREPVEAVVISGINGEVSVDLSKWSYALTAFDDASFFDVEFVVDATTEHEHNDLLIAALLCLEFLLGEEMVIERIDRVSVTKTASPELATRLTPIKYLPHHVEDLLREAGSNSTATLTENVQ